MGAQDVDASLSISFFSEAILNVQFVEWRSSAVTKITPLKVAVDSILPIIQPLLLPLDITASGSNVPTILFCRNLSEIKGATHTTFFCNSLQK